MWLQLSDDTTFNLSIAQALKVGSAGGSSENFALVAELPGGEEVVLAEYHLPQAAQQALEQVNQALKDGTRLVKL
ncbi:MAG: hypothetical protein ACE5KM_15935 [Planctomycetaceae bacterium]